MVTFVRERIVLLGALVALLALVAVACGSSEDPTATPRPAATAVPGATSTPAPTAVPEDAPKYGGIFTTALDRDTTQGADTMRATTISNYFFGVQVWGAGNLIRPCRDDGIARCPALADSWESNADFTQWTFTIRDGVFWHDGTPFTPEDVKFWMDLGTFGAEGRIPDPGALSRYGDIASVGVLSGNQVRVTLNAPAPNYLLSLGDPLVLIQHPRHLMQVEIDKGNGEATAEELGSVGTGPFALDEIVKGSVYRARRFEQYWEKDDEGRQLPYLDGVDAFVIPDQTAKYAAFLSGRLDFTNSGPIAGLKIEQAENIESSMADKADIRKIPGGMLLVGFNTIKPPFDDIRLRRAISLYLDRQAMGDAIERGKGSTPTGLFFPTLPWTNPDVLTWPGYNNATKAQDREEAKRLMVEAGFPDGFKTSLVVTRTSSAAAPMEFLVSDILGLGIESTLERLQNSVLAPIKCDGSYEMIGNFNTGVGLFPDTLASRLVSLSKNRCADFSKHDDPKVDDLLQQIVSSGDHAERVRLAREVEKYLLLDKVYLAPFYTRWVLIPVRGYVEGLQLTRTVQRADYLDHAWVWLDK